MKDIKLYDDHNVPLKEVVYMTLRGAIVKGDVAPGERLMEIHLAKMLGVSRTPVREAIRKLEIDGFVVLEAGKGAKVSGITEKDMRDMLDVRKALEVLAVELACRRSTKEDITKLSKVLNKFIEAVDKGENIEIANADVEFHDTIYTMARNEKLSQIIEEQMQQMYRYRLEYIKNKAYHIGLVNEHVAIFEAIKNKDVDLCRTAIENHIQNQEKAIMMEIKTKF